VSTCERVVSICDGWISARTHVLFEVVGSLQKIFRCWSRSVPHAKRLSE